MPPSRSEVARNFGGILPANPLMILGEPIAEPGISCRRAIGSQQIPDQAFVFLPGQNRVIYEPAGYQRCQVGHGRWHMDQLQRTPDSAANETNQFLEREGFRANGVHYRVLQAFSAFDDKSRHVLDINRSHAILTILGNTEDWKATKEPRNVVDEYVFRAKDHRRPQDRVRKS